MSPASKPTISPEEFESVRILRLEPGDEIVLRVGSIGEESILALKAQAKERWPDHRVTVLHHSVDIEVVRS